jgi:hypothetical protein
MAGFILHSAPRGTIFSDGADPSFGTHGQQSSAGNPCGPADAVARLDVSAARGQ